MAAPTGSSVILVSLLVHRPKVSTIFRVSFFRLGGAVKTSIVDIRYRIREILDALERNECVTVLHHGKIKGVIHPAGKGVAPQAANHAFFGMHGDFGESVAEEANRLRDTSSRGQIA
jgi:hypothetical protein